MSLFDDFVFRMNENGESWNDVQYMKIDYNKKEYSKFEAAEKLKGLDINTMPRTMTYYVYTAKNSYYNTGYATKRWVAFIPLQIPKLW